MYFLCNVSTFIFRMNHLKKHFIMLINIMEIWMQRLNTIIIFIVLHIVLCTIIDPLRYIGLTLGRCPYASFSLFCVHTWVSTTLFQTPLFRPSWTDLKPSKPHPEMVLGFKETSCSLKPINTKTSFGLKLV